MRRSLVVTGLALVLLAVLVVVAPTTGRGATEVGSPAVRILSSDSDGITLELIVPGPAVEAVTLDGQSYAALSIPGLASGLEPGQPDLPRKVVLLGVPPGAGLRLEAAALETEILPGAYRVAPVPEWVALEEGDVRYLEPVYAASTTGGTYPAGSTYPAALARVAHTGQVRSQRVASLELVPFRYDPASGELHLVRRMQVRLAFDYPAGTPDLSATRAEESSFEAILSRTLLNYESARAWRAPAPDATASEEAAASRFAAPWTPPDPAWKVRLNETGLYRLAYADLDAAGLPVDTLDPDTLKLYNDGVEVAIHVTVQQAGTFAPGDHLEFYGQGLDTRYTDTNVYWLTHGGAPGLRMAERDGTPSGAPVPTSFGAQARVEQNVYYWSSKPGDDRWYWQWMRAISPTHSPEQPVIETFTGTLGLAAADAQTATVGVYLLGVTFNDAYNPDHHALVYLNDHLVVDALWDGKVPYWAEVEVPHSYLADITNTFRIEMPADTGAPYDGVNVDYFTVAYRHPFRAVDDELAFGYDVSGTWQFRAYGFSQEDILAFDVTDPARVVRITGGASTDPYATYLPLASAGWTTATLSASPPSVRERQAGAAFNLLRFQDTVSGTAGYLVLAADRARAPLSIERDAPSNLAGATAQVDYLLIAHDDLYTSTLPLAAYWASQGLAVERVRLADVYDEFSYGLPDPAAIRDLLAHTYANRPAPQVAYALLVGDATYDYRDYMGHGLPANVPTYLLPTPYIGETGSDNWYAAIAGGEGDYLPDLHVGRLPARSAAEADGMVAKILAYAQTPPPGDWNRNVLFVADNADGAGDFAWYSDVLVDGYLPPAYTPQKVYYRITHMNQPAVTAAITGTLNTTGTLVVNYIGHGAIFAWAHELLYMCYGDRCDFDDLTNGGALPFVVSMTCSDGYYIHPDPAFTSLAEGWLLAGGGGIATFAATGLGVASGHDWMNRGLFTALFSDTLALGPSTTESKLYLHAQTGGYQDLIETYHLFGDPALPLNLP